MNDFFGSSIISSLRIELLDTMRISATQNKCCSLSKSCLTQDDSIVRVLLQFRQLFRSLDMSEVDKINEQIAALTAQRESVMLKERANVLAKMKADIKLYGFKTTDFKGVLATRKKRGTATKRVAAKKTTK